MLDLQLLIFEQADFREVALVRELLPRGQLLLDQRQRLAQLADLSFRACQFRCTLGALLDQAGALAFIFGNRCADKFTLGNDGIRSFFSLTF